MKSQKNWKLKVETNFYEQINFHWYMQIEKKKKKIIKFFLKYIFFHMLISEF